MAADGVFEADEILAKHDENYMPPEVADALKKGHEAGVEKMKKEAQQQPSNIEKPTPAPEDKMDDDSPSVLGGY